VRAIVPDQRGFGESDRPHGSYSIRRFADDAIALLEELRIERAVFVGHSFGTFVARQVAIAAASRVSRLILIGTGACGSNDVTRAVNADMQRLGDLIPLEFAREFQAGTVYAPLPPEFFDTLVQESLKLPARLWKAVFSAILAYDDRADLARIAAPTRLLWGDHDALFSRDEQDTVAAAIPHATLKVYPDTGHCPNWERPEEVSTDIARFLQDTSAAS
jgi:pimeloyl-ACP methyl ester carboxylesterase